MKYLGIDIGGTAVKMGIVTEKGEILNKCSYDVAFDSYETPIPLKSCAKRLESFKNISITFFTVSNIGVS